ncbi:MAG: 3-hydroxyacyl-CoA dehydrogenase family protein [Candidatus Bathyarchaeota archaeon]|nr:3-hydroxyacyl-CoA dehydrogenase family protein [Candidatus Bathyarchaeota archaeon]
MVRKINVISVIGAGYLGKQIIKKSLIYNYDIKAFDINNEDLAVFTDDMRKMIKEKNLKATITQYSSIADAVKDVDLVIEAIPEKLELKRDVFSQIDNFSSPYTIIATNSSSIPISKIEDAVNRKDKVMNIHFYDLFLMPLADIMRGSQTSEETFEKGREWLENIEITPLEVKKECYGFVMNRIWRAIKKDCLKIWAGGHADIETVDKAWKTFCQFFVKTEFGPFYFMDRIGLDVIYDIEMSYFKNSGLSDDKPPELLNEMIKRGELGVKSGKGFYNYETQ